MPASFWALTLLVWTSFAANLCGDDIFSIFSSIELPTQTSLRFVPGDFDPFAHEMQLDEPSEADDEFIEEAIDPSPAAVYYRHEPDGRVTVRPRMLAEFERQSALMVAGGALCDSAPGVLSDLAAAVSGRVPLVILVNDEVELNSVNQELKLQIPPSQRILFVPHNTVWARDYGPTILSDKGKSVVVDAAYDIDRSGDDQVPSVVAGMTRTTTRHTNLCIPGGNLLTNGRGLCITTTRIQDENAGKSQTEIANSIGDSYGANIVAILEPLSGEATGHVDMFATFTDESTVVVGRYEHVTDPDNAAILDRNAGKLASIRIGGRKLRVVRIPMPSRRDDLWPTFTNVVYANGRLLVPTYESTTPRQRQKVSEIYGAVMPGWEIRFIRVDDLISSGGALHCVVSNLGTLRFTPPKTLAMRTMRR